MISTTARAPNVDEFLSADLRARLGSALPDHLFIDGFTIRPMRRRPGSRHVFSYRLVLGDQKTGKQNVLELVAKRDTTRAAGKAAKEFEALRLLWESGFGQTGRLRIPQPLHHFEDLQLIVQGKARGTRLRAFLGEGSKESLEHARASGLWLATMHGLPLDASRTCGYDNEKTSLHKFVHALCADQPRLAPVVRHYGTMIEQGFDTFDEVPATWVHGDFHPDHIFVNRKSVTVIDFERFGIGDPARDLGSFIAHMRTTACFSGKSLAGVNREIDAFLASYFGGTTPRDERIKWRVAPFVALSCLEALYYVASVLKVTERSRIALYVHCLELAGLPSIDGERRSPAERWETIGQDNLQGGAL